MAVSLITLAAAHRAAGDPDRATALAERAIEVGRTVTDVWVVAAALVQLGAVAADRGDWSAVARLTGTLSTYQDLTGALLRPADETLLGETVARARREMSDADYRCSHVLGQATDIREAEQQPPAS